ncbi:MAG: GDSL-type esterase/lipase family protein [Leptolyngbyaceae cyanobacterium bins.349]|nr:GDSL-type esterase/lipase family protein [Leptolyngbyaceae cyanobacterium bins.349]
MTFPKWALLPGVVGIVLLLTGLVFSQRGSLTTPSEVNASTLDMPQFESLGGMRSRLSQLPPPPVQPVKPTVNAEPSYKLTYEQWVKLLAQEARVVAQKPPEQLYVLAGDSLSLWFPVDLLPPGVTWLNQGISGETSYGLLRRVKFLDQTKPQIIFVMIGINDLIRGLRYETVAANHREIMRHLKAAHPQARIVVQSILPHGGDRATQRYQASVKGDPAAAQTTQPLWVKRLPVITNDSIRRLNQRLALITQEEKVQFLDLHPLFVDPAGNLRDDLTTDGLHLSPAGYALWRSQLQSFLPAAAATVSP